MLRESCYVYQSMLYFLFACIFTLNANAHNGKISYVYPVDNIRIDGDLSDWSTDIQPSPFTHYLWSFQPENDKDCQATVRLGYNLSEQSLYVGIELIDDKHVRNPENPTWQLIDLQTLHLDIDHSKDNSGVIGYEYSQDTSYIVHQKSNLWNAQVQNASWDDVEVKMTHKDGKTVCEWKIFLGDKLTVNRTIGFDYTIIDNDEEGSFGFLNWGPNPGKHDNANNLSDLVFVENNTSLGKIKGHLNWEGKGLKDYPKYVRLTKMEQPDSWVQVAVDSNGIYEAELPEAVYSLRLAEGLLFQKKWQYNFDIFQAKALNLPFIEVKAGERKNIARVRLQKIAAPDLLPEKGLLHDFDTKATTKVDHFIKSYQGFYGIPGVSLALIKDGKVVYHKTYGVRNTMTNESITENTLFEAASITKTVFAYTVHRLVEKGLIDLDKPLHEYLPFEAIAKKEDYKLMTGRHVLRHLSGLPNWGQNLENTPGTKYGYSGEGFEYLKRVVMHITGKSMQQILDEEVINPIGLTNTYFSQNKHLAKVASEGHFNQNPTLQTPPNDPGMAWSMYTEAKDFSKFAIHLLNKKGLKLATYQEMLTLYNEYPMLEGEPQRPYPNGMGQGIAIRKTPFGQTFGHGGSNGDFKCYYEMYDGLKMGYIIFTNADMGDYLHPKMAELLVEGKKKAQVVKLTEKE